VAEIKGGKRRVRERKKYPGYIFIELEVDEKNQLVDKAWYLIRETSGIGDFVGPGSKPSPMSDREVEKMLGDAEKREGAPQVKIDFKLGDSVKIKQGPFENFDGIVEEVFPNKGIVKVIVTIFGRPTPVELEYWQVEAN
jgi:transcriptional antiterminator NusG